MRGGDSTISTKRIYNTVFQLSLGAEPTSDHTHHPKRSSSKLVNSNIDDLPEVLMIEILCRLPCYRFVSQCKCVSKRWCTIMANSYFMTRFLCLQSDHMQTPIIGTVINSQGMEFLSRMPSSSKPLTPLFKRLMSFHDLKEEPVVVGTYNDLVLCCASMFHQHDYYICNPYTIQWVSLPPPPPHVYSYLPLGFICDQPFYIYKKDDQKGHIIQLNAEYKCRVVRLIFPDNETPFSNFKVQIFSSETGEWRELIVSHPSGSGFKNMVYSTGLVYGTGFVYNKMLYWTNLPGSRIFGLDPFMINCSSSITGDDIIDHCKCHLIEVKSGSYVFRCLGVCGGYFRMCSYDYAAITLIVWDLNEEDLMDVIYGGARELCVEQMMIKVYPLDEEMVPDEAEDLVNLLAFDPNDEDILYLQIDRDIVMCDIYTAEWSKIVEKTPMDCNCIFPFALPWWPTPVPRLPQHAHLAIPRSQPTHDFRGPAAHANFF